MTDKLYYVMLGFVGAMALIITFMLLFTANADQHGSACGIVKEKVLLSLRVTDSLYSEMSLLEADSVLKVADSILQECYCGDINGLLEKYEDLYVQ